MAKELDRQKKHSLPSVHYYQIPFNFAFLKDPIPFRSGPRCPHATANIVCISVLSRVEAESIQRRRAKTMWENMLEPPTILLGLDIEARSNPDVVHKLFLEPSLSTGKVGPVIPEEGERLAQEIGAVKYMECSVNDTAQVEAVFQDALRIATRSPWNNLAEWVVAFQNSY
ncbi:hypothetical protein SISNIDRAFT_465158 [Sistotremastrum niveocremeum HHB9708]|uniref:Uncharacterized protein n=1 Tax=Sistotremastrum niveocremeum HHB9708 TaxID=1314777 RepID=A0A164WBR2_9AGAM|nr:hypothetical protein SISNIDRAFT_465158 [Sistotremastrum niveocremeum HHB9708]